MGIITGHRAPHSTSPLQAGTFRVLREPESSELSCTSMSGSWYLESTGEGCPEGEPGRGQRPKAPLGLAAL